MTVPYPTFDPHYYGTGMIQIMPTARTTFSEDERISTALWDVVNHPDTVASEKLIALKQLAELPKH